MQENTTSTKTGKHHKKIYFLSAVIILIMLILGGAWWLIKGRFTESTDDAYVGGRISAISPRVSGYVAKILVQDNAYVHAGEPLIELDTADFKAQYDAVLAQVDAAQVTIKRLHAQYALTQSNITQLTFERNAHQAALTFAKQESQRYQQLAKEKAGSIQQKQSAISQNHQAQAQYQASVAAIDAKQHQLTVIQAEIKEALAALKQAQAELKKAQLNLSYTLIKAPKEGYIGNRSVSVGTFVPAGTQLMYLVPRQGLWVDANFKEDQLKNMRLGQSVTIKADINSQFKVTGHVESLSPATGSVFSLIPAQNATGNFTKIVQRVPVRIALDEPFSTLGSLRPGLSVTAKVDTHPVER